VLTGSARLAKEAQERMEAQQQGEELVRRRREIASRRAATERQIAELHATIAAQDIEVARLVAQEERRETVVEKDRAAMGASRGVAHRNGEDMSRPASPVLRETRETARTP
jgi:circadian clock protein KaiC